jgi:bacteriocin-like protein
MSNAVKDENVITTLVNATANGQEACELTEHELNAVAGGVVFTGMPAFFGRPAPCAPRAIECVADRLDQQHGF